MRKIPIAIIGLGKIATDQHIPAIHQSKRFDLTAIVTKDGKLANVPTYNALDEMLLHHPEIQAVSLCVPPEPRYDLARAAISAGKHVLLEKPPATSIVAAQNLVHFAAGNNVTLFAAWHSKYAAAVEPARQYLRDKKIQAVDVIWKEDVRQWHPGQDWIWSPGNLGVFDPGINALSILTAILPDTGFVSEAILKFPENRATPIAATLKMRSMRGYSAMIALDWRETETQTWQIMIETSEGSCNILDGGARLEIDGSPIDLDPNSEYPELYDDYANLIDSHKRSVDLAPLQHVADAFMLGRREIVDAFN